MKLLKMALLTSSLVFGTFTFAEDELDSENARPAGLVAKVKAGTNQAEIIELPVGVNGLDNDKDGLAQLRKQVAAGKKVGETTVADDVDAVAGIEERTDFVTADNELDEEDATTAWYYYGYYGYYSWYSTGYYSYYYSSYYYDYSYSYSYSYLGYNYYYYTWY